jgi:hypothetical protein
MVFVGLAASAGVRVVAGTDTPNPFVLPGQSLHDELELLLVVRGDPVSSITATRSVALVIKSGRIVYTEDPSLPPPGF